MKEAICERHEWVVYSTALTEALAHAPVRRVRGDGHRR